MLTSIRERKVEGRLSNQSRTNSNQHQTPSLRQGDSLNCQWDMDYKYIRSTRSRKKAERERFYTNDLPHLLPTTKFDMLLAGDFNYILEINDSSEQKHFSRALASIVNELDLHDMWNTTSTNKGYTHYASETASRLDRIYVTKHL